MHGRNTVRTDKERERKKKQVTNRCFKPPNEDKCFIISASVTKSDTLQTSINMKYQACCHINDGGASRVHQPSAKTYRSHAIMRRLLLLWQSSVITAMRSKTSVHGLWRLPPFYFDIPLIYDSSCRQTERDRERERTRGVMPREREREIGRCGYSWPERGVPTISTTTLAGPEEEIGSVFFLWPWGNGWAGFGCFERISFALSPVGGPWRERGERKVRRWISRGEVATGEMTWTTLAAEQSPILSLPTGCDGPSIHWLASALPAPSWARVDEDRGYPFSPCEVGRIPMKRLKSSLYSAIPTETLYDWIQSNWRIRRWLVPDLCGVGRSTVPVSWITDPD